MLADESQAKTSSTGSSRAKTRLAGSWRSRAFACGWIDCTKTAKQKYRCIKEDVEGKYGKNARVKWGYLLKADHSNEVHGRLRIIRQMKSENKLSLDIGSGVKEFRLADITVDIDLNASPDIKADVIHLPFRPNVFDLCFFTEVIEHLPKGTELKGLKEIHRVLCKGGEMILTTPHRRLLFILFDPAWYLGHRHYRKHEILELLKQAGFQVLSLVTRGKVWAWLNRLWYCFIVYPWRKVVDRRFVTKGGAAAFVYSPSFLLSRDDKEYGVVTENGYNIFIRAKKGCFGKATA